jgi:vacuolar-type H+-ATPase catalytic subunit A/Vma1
MSIHDLGDYKKKKMYGKLMEDINKILHIISLTQKSLSYFKQYIPVQKLISIMETQKTLLEIHRDKAENELEKIKEKHTEQGES